MKVLHINSDYIGTPLHQLLVNNLEAKDIDNWVFVPTSVNEPLRITLRDKDVIKRCFSTKDRFLFRVKQNKIINAFNETVKEHFSPIGFAPDIIHAYFLFTDGSCARKISQRYSIPYVVAVRNTDVNAFFKYRIFLRHIGVKNMLYAKKVFFLSEAYRQKVLSKYVPSKYRQEIENKSIVIPNGIDDYWLNNRFTSRDYSEIHDRFREKKLRIIYAGCIDKNKNIELTLKAIKELQKSGWTVEFNVIGRIADKGVYKKIIKENVIHYYQQMAKEQLIEKYRMADIFVMPSHHETFGLVYAEAMSQGLPIIYTRGQGFDGQFDEGKVGYSVNDYSSEELVKRIMDIVEDYENISRTELKEFDKFNWKRIAYEYESIYKEMVR